MLITNDCIACKPVVSQAKAENSNPFSSWQNKEPVVELEILFGDNDYKFLTGGKVYIRPYLEIPPFMKETFMLGEKEFILVPKNMIIGYASPFELGAPVNIPSVWQVPVLPTDNQNPWGQSSNVTYTLTYGQKQNCSCGCGYCKFEV